MKEKIEQIEALVSNGISSETLKEIITTAPAIFSINLEQLSKILEIISLKAQVDALTNELVGETNLNEEKMIQKESDETIIDNENKKQDNIDNIDPIDFNNSTTPQQNNDYSAFTNYGDESQTITESENFPEFIAPYTPKM